MLRYGLKLWSSNEAATLEEAARLITSGAVQCAELYHNPGAELDFKKLAILKGLPITIHAPNSHGWHEFNLELEHLTMWQDTLKLADFFNSPIIVVHPGKTPSLANFKANLAKIDDPRILIENMPGFDIYGHPLTTSTLEQLVELKKLKSICFDFEKAVKSAALQKIDYKTFIVDCLSQLQPTYFHISGGDKDSPIDQHENLWDATFDIAWIREQLATKAKKKDMTLIFETKKVGLSLENDLKNITHFKECV